MAAPASDRGWLWRYDDDDGGGGGGGGGGGYDVRSQEDPRQQIRPRGEQLMVKAVEI